MPSGATLTITFSEGAQRGPVGPARLRRVLDQRRTHGDQRRRRDRDEPDAHAQPRGCCRAKHCESPTPRQPAGHSATLIRGGLSVAAFELEVENHSELTLAPTPLDTGGLVDAYVITLDFSEPLDPDVAPPPTVFAISGHEAQVHTVSVVGRKVLLQVLPPVAPDLFPAVSYSPAQSGALESLLKPASEVAAFTRELNNTTSGPVVTAIAVEGSRVALTFSAPLRAKGTISPATFGICPTANADDDDCAAATMLAVDGAVVTLTAPADALRADTEVWLRYSGGSESDHLHDQYNSSAIVPAIAGHPFRTPQAAPTPPALLTASGDGTTVTLTFDRDLHAGSVPAVAAFLVNHAAPSEVALDGAVVTLTLAAALADGEAASVSYTPPEQGALQGADGIAAAAFTQAVANRTDHAPVAESGEVDAAGRNADESPSVRR